MKKFLVIALILICPFIVMRTELKLQGAYNVKTVELKELITQTLPNVEGHDGEMTSGAQGLKPVVNEVEDVLNEYDVIKEINDASVITALVDKTYHLDAMYEPDDLREVNVEYSNPFSGATQTMLRDEAATALEQLFEAASRQGHHLLARSGYRSYETQEALYKQYVASDGVETADTYSARPGHSEHQTGLAIDITSDTVGRRLVVDFGQTEEGMWLAEHAHQYGFILSYPAEAVEVTGYQYEPWHFRYVGCDVAQTIYENHWLLRDYAVAVGHVN